MRNVKNKLISGITKMSKAAMKQTRGGEREVYYTTKLTDVRITRNSNGFTAENRLPKRLLGCSGTPPNTPIVVKM